MSGVKVYRFDPAMALTYSALLFVCLVAMNSCVVCTLCCSKVCTLMCIPCSRHQERAAHSPGIHGNRRSVPSLCSSWLTDCAAPAYS